MQVSYSEFQVKGFDCLLLKPHVPPCRPSPAPAHPSIEAAQIDTRLQAVRADMAAEHMDISHYKVTPQQDNTAIITEQP